MSRDESMSQHDFCRVLLNQARESAKECRTVLPKRMTAISSTKDQWFVEADGMKSEYIKADCAYEAKAKMIYKLIDAEETIRRPKKKKTFYFGVRYQEHKLTDRSDNPNPKVWRVTAESPEQAFILGQQRAKQQRAKGRNIGHVFREMFREDGSVVVAEGDYIERED